MSRPTVLPPAVAGTWYPADPRRLTDEVDALLGDTAAEREPPLALIAPHAGYAYSGAVAARGFGRVRGARCSRVLLIGPSHYEAFRGAAVPEAGALSTPLGPIEIDAEAVAELRKATGFRALDRPFLPEHALEAELPFLQRTLAADWRVVPLLVGADSNAADLERIAGALVPLVTGETRIVISSDFTHFGRRFGYVPFTEDVPRRIRDLDMGAIERIVAGDRGGFVEYCDRTGATICGRGPIEILLRLLPGEVEGRCLVWDNSGAQTGDWTHCVSYAHLAFARSGIDRGARA